MSEKDIATSITLTPTKASINLQPNSISFRIPSTSSRPMIDITKPAQVIFAGDGHRNQYIETTRTTMLGNEEADQKGIQKLSLQIISNATPYTQDFTMKTVIRISLPQDLLDTNRVFYSDGNSALAIEGEEAMVILPSVLQKTAPTQERMALPSPVSTHDSIVSQTPTDNMNSSNPWVRALNEKEYKEATK